MNHFQRLAVTAILSTAGLLASVGALAATFSVDVSGVQSYNKWGEAGNSVVFVNIGANAVLTSLDWAVQLEAFTPSYLSEMQASFGSSSGLGAIDWAPALGVDASGTGSYTGSLDLTGLGIAAGADGLLRIEFSETSKDLIGAADGRWVSGSLGLGVTAVPEPASAALSLLGLGVIALRTRRARRG